MCTHRAMCVHQLGQWPMSLATDVLLLVASGSKRSIVFFGSNRVLWKESKNAQPNHWEKKNVRERNVSDVMAFGSRYDKF